MENEQQFDTFIWKGQTRYRCMGKWESGSPCAFDTADKDALIRHMASPHLRSVKPPEAPMPALPVITVDEEVAAEFKDVHFAFDVDSLDS